MNMLGMGFGSWLTLAIAGLISTLIVGYAIGYRFLGGAQTFFAQWIVGWVGAWLGTPVFGNWGGSIAGIAVIPCLLGAFSGAFLVCALFRGIAKAFHPEVWGVTPVRETPTATEPIRRVA